MEMPVNYIFDLDRDTLVIPNDLKIIFLCGVVFRRRDVQDKRLVLKKYLEQNESHYPVILEENFSIKSYENIDIKNLHDIETLVACFSNAVIIIHESISTGAEIGMLASNKSTASKLLLLYPDEDSVEERKINTFIKEAFYGANPILSEDKNLVVFHPALQKNFETNDRFIYHTYFPNDLSLDGRARKGIDAFLQTPSTQPMSRIIFRKSQYRVSKNNRPDVVDYYMDSSEATICLTMSPMAMRGLLFSALSLEHVRTRIEQSTSMSDVMRVLQQELDTVLLATFRARLGVTAEKTKVNLKGLELSTYQDKTTSDYRKTVGMFIYLLKAMGYLSVEGNTKFKFTRDFVSLRTQFSDTTTITKATTFASRMQKADTK